jgi:hypothetical protein
MSNRKTKLINIEWLFVDTSHYDLIMSEVSIAVQERYNTIIFLALMDGFMGWNPSYWIPLIDKIDNKCKKMGIKEIIFISGAGQTYEYGLPHTHYFYDFNLSVVKNSYKPFYNSIDDYSITSDKFMFLTGRPARPNRIGLMHRLYKANLLNKGVWSFFPPWNDIDDKWCKTYLKDLSNEEYHLFLSSCNKTLDVNNEYDNCKKFLGVFEGDNWHDIVHEPYLHNPAFIDLSFYHNVKLSLISEGPIYWEWCSDRFYLTDKTYREILMKKPILLAGYVEQYKQLKRLGFKLFEDYLLIKDYGLIDDEEQRLDAIAKNTEYFLNNTQNFEMIKNDVDFNSNVLHNHFKNQDKFLDYIETKYNANKEEISFFFGQKGLEHLIRKP